MDTAQVAGAIINRNRLEIADRTVSELMKAHRSLLESQGLSAQDLVDYALRDLSKVFIAVISHRPALFAEYIQWQRSVFFHRDIPGAAISIHLTALSKALQERLSDEEYAAVSPVIEAGVAVLSETMLVEESFIDPEGTFGTFATQYVSLLRENRGPEAVALLGNAVDQGVPIEDTYTYIIQPAQREIGRLWQVNEITVAEEHAATEISRNAMAVLRQRITPYQHRDRRVLTACLGGELHDLGARMVSDLFYLGGYDSFFTGANTPHRVINEELKRREIHVLALSATMTLQVRLAIELIDAVREEYGDRVKVIVGGYAFNRHSTLWRDVGADGYAANGTEAVAWADEITHA